ncbi:3165_t:CDS:2 [Ambispora gerdemannii]|uniref:3165_t:CDS:1 n=1 Tax=Ambispora gerdemannii TaxID=144530 RepID=A0A9N8YZH4_9GLOM|nr:3165_t:CDS:2 [Ambispora gerdemannii]
MQWENQISRKEHEHVEIHYGRHPNLSHWSITGSAGNILLLSNSSADSKLPKDLYTSKNEEQDNNQPYNRRFILNIFDVINIECYWGIKTRTDEQRLKNLQENYSSPFQQVRDQDDTETKIFEKYEHWVDLVYTKYKPEPKYEPEQKYGEAINSIKYLKRVGHGKSRAQKQKIDKLIEASQNIIEEYVSSPQNIYSWRLLNVKKHVTRELIVTDCYDILFNILRGENSCNSTCTIDALNATTLDNADTKDYNKNGIIKAGFHIPNLVKNRHNSLRTEYASDITVAIKEEQKDII